VALYGRVALGFLQCHEGDARSNCERRTRQVLSDNVNGVSLELVEGGEDDTVRSPYGGVGFKDSIEHCRVGVSGRKVA
jgi:hypothetical protein